MGAIELERLSWPEVRAELDAGRDTVVVAFGAVEQHGPHLPLGTDSVLGDELGRSVAERLDAFVAPTIRIGCSSHHLAFAGTLSVDEETFHRVVADVVRALAGGGFARVVLLPTHGGNFAPLAAAVEKLGPVEGTRVVAVSDLTLLMRAAFEVADELGVSRPEAGVHAGEWETSMMLALRPDEVNMGKAAPGYVGELEPGLERMFTVGIDGVDPNGVFGDPRRASAEAGERYVQRLTELVVEFVDNASD